MEMICHCGEPYSARESDLKRGWGYSCSKSCAAKRRDFGLPRAKRADGLRTKKTRSKPSGYRPNDKRINDSDYGKYGSALDWYASTQVHPFSSEGLGQD